MDAQPDIAEAGRILVVGAGATGGFFGMRLAQRGRDVTFLVRQARAEALRTHGLHLTGLGRDDVIFPPLVTAQVIQTSYDVVLLAVKATALAQAIDDLAPAVGPATVILPFLNGLDHMRVLNERFGPQRVLGGAVKVVTDVAADGTIVQLAPLAEMIIGEQNGELSARIADVAKLLSGAGFGVGVAADIASAMWSKWVFIASIGALTCLMRAAVGEIVAAPGGADLGPGILGEAAAIAAAAGHPLPPGEREATRKILTEPGAPTTSSMYRDLQAGRGTEVEQILGDLIGRARSFSLGTPLLDLATLTLRVYEHRRSAEAEEKAERARAQAR
jgi:2-dehydropantoate 2-reductase